MSGIDFNRRAAVTLVLNFLLAGPLLLSAESVPGQINSVADLGLEPADVPVSTESKIVYLVNPILNRPAELEALLLGGVFPDPAPPGWSPVPFGRDEIASLVAPGRPGDTRAYDAVADVVEQFFKYMFSQIPSTERSLHSIVQEVNREDFPLAAVDATTRFLKSKMGTTRALETLVTLRLFMVHVDGDRERNLRWVKRCELCFEDSAVGRSVLQSGTDLPMALSASVLDALRGKIARSFTHTPALRRPSGKIEEPRRDLMGRSLSNLAEEHSRLAGAEKEDQVSVSSHGGKQ